jgi:hypothetical protein
MQGRALLSLDGPSEALTGQIAKEKLAVFGPPTLLPPLTLTFVITGNFSHHLPRHLDLLRDRALLRK